MPSEISIFKNQEVAATGSRELSPLAESLATSTTTRRIQANTNGTFKRLINGEVIGKGIRGEINLIIIDALPEVSRIYYEKDYDPDAPPTLPNCFSNLGDKPEEGVPDQQHENCAKCPKNVKGSGKLAGSRACRFQRRLAVLVEGDESGDIYQFNVPAKSLFGKGVDNIHPFESYIKYLIANKQSPDNVITNVSFDENAETLELLFTPVREISDEEYELVKVSQTSPECTMYTKLTVGYVDGVKKLPPAAKDIPKEKIKKAVKDVKKVTRSDEPDDDDVVVVEPVKKSSKKPKTDKVSSDLADVIDQWAQEDDDA